MGAYLSAPVTTKHTTNGETDKFAYASSEMQGWRLTMEDSKITDPSFDRNTSLFGVFDGHGGKEVAKFVEKHFCKELKANRAYKSGQIEQALSETFLRMDTLIISPAGQKELIRTIKELPEDANVTENVSESYAGCTAVVAAFHKNKLYVANAGDSRCVLGRRGQAVEMTIDHKPDLPQELQRITRAGGHVEDGRVMGNLNLSRSIGDMEYKQNPNLPPSEQMITAMPEIKSCDITRDCDFAILACDGIWDVMTSQQCVDFVYQRLDRMQLRAIVEEMLDYCLAPDVTSMGGLGCDNMTAVLVRIKQQS